MPENNAFPIATGNTDVRFPGFPRAVDNTAHNSHSYGFLAVPEGFFNLLCQFNQANSGSATGGTGDDGHTLLRPASSL